MSEPSKYTVDLPVGVWSPPSITLGFSEFVQRSQLQMSAIQPVLPSLIGDAMRRGGQWHPTGFLILNLLDVEGLGIVRLHLWPSMPRVRRPGHPVIHRHCFHLFSLVVHGEYSEVRFQAGGVDAPNPQYPRPASMVGFRIMPSKGDGWDRIEPDGLGEANVWRLTRRSHEFVGMSHQMVAGVYHSTAIPVYASCATLAILSRPIVGQQDHLLGKPGSRVDPRPRVYVSLAEVQGFMDEMGLTAGAVAQTVDSLQSNWH